MLNLALIDQDPHLYASEHYSLLTIYDDNLFVRNDYDVLTPGQRRYIIKFAEQNGFKQTRGTELNSHKGKLLLPRPASSLACSVFNDVYLNPASDIWYCITPTGFAETIFHDMYTIGSDEGLTRLKALINKCPFNIEWLRDISYGSKIEEPTKYFYQELTDYQKAVIAAKFRNKRTIK